MWEAKEATSLKLSFNRQRKRNTTNNRPDDDTVMVGVHHCVIVHDGMCQAVRLANLKKTRFGLTIIKSHFQHIGSLLPCQNSFLFIFTCGFPEKTTTKVKHISRLIRNTHRISQSAHFSKWHLFNLQTPTHHRGPDYSRSFNTKNNLASLTSESTDSFVRSLISNIDTRA